MEEKIVAIDLGGTFIKGALLNLDGTIIKRHKQATEVSKGKRQVLDNICKAIAELSKNGRPDAVGIGVPGIITPETGSIVKSPNFPGWEDFPIKSSLQARIEHPVYIDNDANCAAMGEKWLGAGKNLDDFIMLTLGTGIGGGIVLDGKVHSGKTGRGGELGHTTLDINGRKCNCGAFGCLEAYAGGLAIVNITSELANKSQSGILWKDHLAKNEKLTPRIIYHAALNGDKISIDTYTRAGSFLGAGIASFVNILDLRTFIIGGGVAEGFELLEEPMRKAIARHTYGIDPEIIKVIMAETGNDAGIIGAAYICLEIYR